jgi:hypothetical protein
MAINERERVRPRLHGFRIKMTAVPVAVYCEK